jgi:hypothetical protein
MTRHLTLLVLSAAILAGCGSAQVGRMSAAQLANSAAPAPTVSLVAGLASELAPTVSVKPGVATAPVIAASQAAVSDIAAQDVELDALDAMTLQGDAYKLQGWWTDLKDSLKKAWQRFKLKSEIRQALKHKDKLAFDLLEGTIDVLSKHRTNPIVKVTPLAGGGQEISSSWTSTHKGTFAIEVKRVTDADGVTQTLSVSTSGTLKNGTKVEVLRVKTLTGDDGTYQTTTREKRTYEDGRYDLSEWSKKVNLDGTEVITGFINHRDGNRTEITGTRDAKGKVRLEVSKIAPAHNPGDTLADEVATDAPASGT